MARASLSTEAVKGKRVVAWIIDNMILSLIEFIVAIPLIFLGYITDLKVIQTILMIISLLGYLLKDVFGGRSIGKRIFGLYVRDYENAKQVPSFFKLILRNITLPIWFIEALIMLRSPKGRRLGDKLANTQVIGYQRTT